MSPSRRDLFRTCSTALSLAVGLSGCLSSSGPTNETVRTTTPTEVTSRSTGDGIESETTTTSETTPGPPPEVGEVDPTEVAERGVPRSPSIESDTYDPFRAFVVGERPENPGDRYETPHVWVWNLTRGPTTVALALTTGDADLLDVEAELPAGEPLAFVFRDRGTYELAVRVGDREETVAVTPDRFWCNATGTDVLVRREGIDSDTVSTAMACTTTADGT